MEKIKKNINYFSVNCPVRKSLIVLGGKWTLLILSEINNGVLRYGELKKAISGISEKMLIQELNNLIKYGLVTKKSFPVIPPKVEYRLTQKGLMTLPIVDSLNKFGTEHLSNIEITKD